MKLKIILFTIVSLLLPLATQPLMAITSSSTVVSSEMIDKQKTHLKNELKAKSKLNKLERLFQKAGIDLKDPIRKWMWYCIFSIVATLGFFLLAVLSASSSISTAIFLTYLTQIAGLAALITGVVFLIKNNF
jgi:hypothetical protein